MHFAKHFIATGRQKPTSIPNHTASTTFNVSISGKGKCYDNTAVETFFKTIKAELIWRHPWETWRKAEIAIFEYINGFYNPRRRTRHRVGKARSLSIGRWLTQPLGAAR